MNKISTIFWDFDGVLMNSNLVRDYGFKTVLSDFPQNEVDQLMAFHQSNGGLSRYVKFKYFFEEIRNEEITEIEIKVWANKFSNIMLESLCKSELLIDETISFVKEQFKNYDMHIVSGSDGEELKIICEKLNISQYFKSINGSPTPKTTLVKMILDQNNYPNDSCVLIGDSINDYYAAMDHSIYFKAYNNPILEVKTNLNFSF